MFNSSSNLSTDGSSNQNFNYFVKYQDGGETPFDSNLDESFEEDILNSFGVSFTHEFFIGFFFFFGKSSNVDILEKLKLR